MAELKTKLTDASVTNFLMRTVNFASWLALGLLLIACQSATELPPTPTPGPITLRFTYWGSPVEKIAIEHMVRAFEAAHPHIQVEALHFSPAEYLGQVSSMFAEGHPPDIGYFNSGESLVWASEGKILDLTEIVGNDAALSLRLPETYYFFAPGRTLGTNTAVETVVMFYNPAVFAAAGLPYPPASPEAAWTWPEFIAVAQRLTTDINGRHPNEPNFDWENVDVYGVSFGTDWWGWVDYYPFIYSNGGEVVNADGTRLMLDTPEAIEAIQRLRDLWWVDRVMPTPAQAKNRPPVDAQFQAGKLAMVIGGQWKLLDYANLQGLNYGLAVLPKMKTPKTLILGSPTVIFSGTQHLEAALEFYKFHNNPQVVELYAQGLWMPLEKSYYTDSANIALWLDNPAHPPEAREVLVDYTLCCVVRTPHYYVKNYAQIAEEAIDPAMNAVWANTLDVATAMQMAVEKAQPLMQGRWDK